MDREGRVNNVFVYGTLLSGQHNNRLLATSRLVGKATLLGRLYSLGSFPAMRLDWTGVVSGEVWSVDDRTLERLDELEGVAHGFYARRAVRPILASGQAVAAYVYEISADTLTPETEQIYSGDWIDHLQKRGQPCRSGR